MKKLLLPTMIFLALIIILFTQGCIATSQPVPPPGCEGSLIYAKIKYPHMVKASLFLANAAAIKKGLYSGEQVLDVFNDLDALLTPEALTYKAMVDAALPIINTLNADAGFVIIGMAPAIMMLNDEIPLNPCDREMLLGLVGEMRVTVMALMLMED